MANLIIPPDADLGNSPSASQAPAAAVANPATSPNQASNTMNGAVGNTSNPPQVVKPITIPEGADLGVSQNFKTPSSYLDAFAQKWQLGVQHYKSTVDKAIEKVTAPALQAIGLGKYAKTPEDTQAEYEQNVKETEDNPNIQAHSTTGLFGELAGGLSATAPLAAIPGAGTAVLGEKAVGLGKFALDAAGNVALGYGVGGVTNKPGQGTNLWNPESAKTGAIGGLFGSAAQRYGESLFANSKSLSQLYNDITKISPGAVGASVFGYSSKSLSTADLVAQDVSDKANTFMTNNILNKIPALGTNPYIAAKKDIIQGVLGDYLKQVGAASNATGIDTIDNILKKTGSILKDQENTQWTQFGKEMDSNSINHIPLSTDTTQQIQNIINNHSETAGKQLSGDLKSLLTNESNRTDFIQAKRDLWPNFVPTNGSEQEAKKSLQNLYGSMSQDLRNTIAGTPVENTFETANQYTIANHTIFDKQHSELLAPALQQVSESQKATQTFIKQMISKDTLTPRQTQEGLGVVGQAGQDTLAGMELKKMFNSSMDFSGSTPRVQLDKLMPQIDKLTESQQLVFEPARKALGGLLDMANNLSKSNPLGAGGTLASGAAAAGGAIGLHMAGGSPVTTTAIAATAPVLSFILSRDPLKNTLISMGLAKENPDFTQYLMEKAVGTLGRAGIVLGSKPDGSISIDKK